MAGASSDRPGDAGKPTTRLKVLFLMATGRSGSTILGNTLGELQGFFHAGELRSLWGRGLLGGRPCGCGLPVRECKFWNAVLEEVAGTQTIELDARAINSLHKDRVRLRYMASMLRPTARPLLRQGGLDEYLDVAERLYLAIGATSGARVIVDSSKQPPDAAALRLLSGVDAYFLHLVRDPRAVSYSWQRRKPSPGEAAREEMIRLTSGASARGWIVANLAAEAVCRCEPADRSLLMRYETFVAHPKKSVERILRLVGEERRHFPFGDDHHVTLKSGHTAGGNPDRFRTGIIELREDTEWRDEQLHRDRLISTAIALPLLRRYGYPILPGGRR